ncbi:MAG: M3 family oligoendopeptidase [bacterium]|nr:M3 family oligoendopeptidase [Candidatus Kapabacteria bacterium]
MTYKHYAVRPERFTREFVAEEFERLVARIDAAEASPTADAWLQLFEDWNALKSYVSSESSRRSHALSKDMNDADLEEADKYLREIVAPVADDGNSAFVNALLASRHRDVIAKRYGDYLIRALETAVEPLAPINSDLRVQVSALVTRYDKIVAGGEITVDGKVVTLSLARGLQSSENAAIRREAFIGYREWFVEHSDEIAEIYDELVALRTKMATNLGQKTFVHLGYMSMGRTDYGQKEVETFRESVRKYAVPLLSRIHKRLAQVHGTPTLMPWDSSYDPELSLPSDVAPVATQLDKAQRVFESLSPELAQHFVRMRDEDLIDLENRKGKRAGAYCTSFPDEGRVAILCNSTGEEEDVRTLMHEMGHAFQGWESQPIEAVDLQWPTSDACEVHSMGMEYLSMRHINEFFTDEQAEKYRRQRWKRAIDLLCWVCVVDEFQHWVYENPTASIEERDTKWISIWNTYITDIDYTDVEQYKVARWHAQGHIFQVPFYYIDYALAETGAMQLALLDSKDHTVALEKYIELCRIGGTKSVLEIFSKVGMRSPFEGELMRELMEHAANEMNLAA